MAKKRQHRRPSSGLGVDMLLAGFNLPVEKLWPVTPIKRHTLTAMPNTFNSPSFSFPRTFSKQDGLLPAPKLETHPDRAEVFCTFSVHSKSYHKLTSLLIREEVNVINFLPKTGSQLLLSNQKKMWARHSGTRL